ncbi:27040_t:CDS:1, partial [Gigaspora margarita]
VPWVLLILSYWCAIGDEFVVGGKFEFVIESEFVDRNKVVIVVGGTIA